MLLLTSLSACAVRPDVGCPAPVPIEVPVEVGPQIPKSYFDLPARPEIPPRPRTDESVTAFVVDSEADAAQCRARLSSIERLLQKPSAPAKP